MPHVYLKFLQNIASLEPIKLKHKDLSPTAILLLNEIAVKDFEQQLLNVSQALGFRALGSPANLHRKLDELLEAGMISLSYVGTNRRTKYLYITKVAFDYFQTKSKAMLEAVETRAWSRTFEKFSSSPKASV
jgi:DNA-binding MarR family transcriptional regulator